MEKNSSIPRLLFILKEFEGGLIHAIVFLNFIHETSELIMHSHAINSRLTIKTFQQNLNSY